MPQRSDFTSEGWRIIIFAGNEAGDCGSRETEPEHLLLALATQDPALDRRLPKATILAEIKKVTGTRERMSNPLAEVPLGHITQDVLYIAETTAKTCNELRIGPRHILHALSIRQNTLAFRLLKENGIGSDLAASASEGGEAKCIEALAAEYARAKGRRSPIDMDFLAAVIEIGGSAAKMLERMNVTPETIAQVECKSTREEILSQPPQTNKPLTL